MAGVVKRTFWLTSCWKLLFLRSNSRLELAMAVSAENFSLRRARSHWASYIMAHQ